jgi:Flp pilus assembly pilin Flp
MGKLRKQGLRMNRLDRQMDRMSQSGVTLAEYAVCLGLVAVATVAGLKLLGGSVNDLFIGVNNSVDSNKAAVAGGVTPFSLTPVNQSSVPAQPFSGTGYYKMVTDPATGLPTLKLVQGGSGNVNVTSVDGNLANVFGSSVIADHLKELASLATDPATKDYYNSLAQSIYYMGGAQGELDSVPGLELKAATDDQPDPYNKADALRDLMVYQTQLMDSLKNPPANVDSKALAAILPYAVDAYNIGNSYANTFKETLSQGGNGVIYQSNVTLPSGTLTVNTTIQPTQNAYDQIVSLDTLKKNSEEVLARESVSPITSTIQDANTVDSATQ